MAPSTQELGAALRPAPCERCFRPALPAARPGRRAQGVCGAGSPRTARQAARAQAEGSQGGCRHAPGEAQLSRRAAALALAALAGALPSLPAFAEPAAPAAPAGEAASKDKFKTLADSILAYAFEYPVTASGSPLSLVLSRRPERYSSAAPLTPDARQRIVSELADFVHGVVVSMTVGPPSGVLKGRTPEQWKPREVAETVLIDRSTARVTEGQRIALQQVETVQSRQADGTTYWTYEHLSQGSPNLLSQNKETYRHAIAVTAWRPALDGTPYLYTLNLSCPDETWQQYGPALSAAAASFRLTPPGKGYVPPDKDPWRFF